MLMLYDYPFQLSSANDLACIDEFSHHYVHQVRIICTGFGLFANLLLCLFDRIEVIDDEGKHGICHWNLTWLDFLAIIQNVFELFSPLDHILEDFS